MEATKILLSADELDLVQDTHWLLTKNRIIEKAKDMFGLLAGRLQPLVEAGTNLPETVRLFSPKVFRGEYYQGLPYVMLDYPRVFGREHVLAMRTMFWWGNFFSVTLQLKGSYLEMFGQSLVRNEGRLADAGYFIGVSEDEWRHDFEADNYLPLQKGVGLLEEAFRNKPFVKLAVRVPLSKWNEAGELIAQQHRLLLDVLND
jgi:hypothetical protein